MISHSIVKHKPVVSQSQYSTWVAHGSHKRKVTEEDFAKLTDDIAAGDLVVYRACNPPTGLFNISVVLRRATSAEECPEYGYDNSPTNLYIMNVAEENHKWVRWVSSANYVKLTNEEVTKLYQTHDKLQNYLQAAIDAFVAEQQAGVASD